MKSWKTFLLAAVVGVQVSGCSILMPKRVELFQDKVKAFPEAKASEKEIQRQTAWRAEEKAKETLSAALATDADQTVVTPASETADLTSAVALSVGPPGKPSVKPSDELASDLRASIAKLNRRIDEFKIDNNENAGKKIEGTGFFQFGYFTMWFWILGALALVVVGIKIYGLVNPVVGLGLNTAGRVSTTLLRRGFQELSEGGEWFKQKIEQHSEPALTKEEILELFRSMQGTAQSRDVQDLVKAITKK